MAITLMNGFGEIENHFYANNRLVYVQRAPEVADKYVQIHSEPAKTNCPNCGAPIRGKRCEYCDTWFISPAEIQRESEPEEINRQIEEIERLKLQIRQVDIAQSMQSMGLMSANQARQYLAGQWVQANLVGQPVDQCLQANIVGQERQQYENTIASLQTNLGPMIFSVDREEDSNKIPWPKRILNALCKF